MRTATVTMFTGCNLEEALDGFNVSKLETKREIERHNQKFNEFLYDMRTGWEYRADAEYYRSNDILHWLGY